MNIPKFIFVILLIIALIIGGVGALPTTGLVQDVGSNNFTMYMNGASTTCWFRYGENPQYLTWKTPNQTPSGGLCNYTARGSPITPVTLYYWRACDVTGCGSTEAFDTIAVTPIPTTTYGSIFQNLTDNNFDVTLIGAATIQPLYWLVPTMPSLIWALLLTGLLVGMWLRGRDLGYVSIFGVVISLAFFGSTYGLGIVVDPVFVALGQGILYATVAGIVLSIIKR